MDRERTYELEVIAPYRKALRPGDVFAMKFDKHFYMHGRIVNTEAIWTGRAEDGLVNTIYVYDQIAADREDYDLQHLTPTRLLIPPVLIPRVGWSKGYFFVVQHARLEPSDLLARNVFRKKGNPDKFFDDTGNEVQPWDGPTGTYAGFTFRSVQLMVLHALGLKCKGDDDAENPRM